MQVLRANILFLLIIAFLVIIFKSKELKSVIPNIGRNIDRNKYINCLIFLVIITIFLTIVYRLITYTYQMIVLLKIWMVPILIGFLLISIKIIRLEIKKPDWSFERLFKRLFKKTVIDYIILPVSIYIVFFTFIILVNYFTRDFYLYLYWITYFIVYFVFALMIRFLYMIIWKKSFQFVLFIIMLWLPLFTGSINFGITNRVILNHSADNAYFSKNLYWLSSLIIIAYLPKSLKFIYDKLIVE